MYLTDMTSVILAGCNLLITKVNVDAHYQFAFTMYVGGKTHSAESENDSRVAPVSEVERHLDLLYLLSSRFQLNFYWFLKIRSLLLQNIVVLSVDGMEHSCASSLTWLQRRPSSAYMNIQQQRRPIFITTPFTAFGNFAPHDQKCSISFHLIWSYFRIFLILHIIYINDCNKIRTVIIVIALVALTIVTEIFLRRPNAFFV